MDLLQILLVVLVANLAVDLVCRRRAAGPWAKPLLLGTIFLDVVCLTPVVKTIVDLSRNRVDGLAGIVLLPGMLLAAASLWLMYQYRSLFYRSGFTKQKSPPNGTPSHACLFRISHHENPVGVGRSPRPDTAACPVSV